MVRAFCQSASAARLALHDGADSCVWLTAFGTTFSTGNASSSRHPSVFLPLPASVLRYSFFGRSSTSVPSERSRATQCSSCSCPYGTVTRLTNDYANPNVIRNYITFTSLITYTNNE